MPGIKMNGLLSLASVLLMKKISFHLRFLDDGMREECFVNATEDGKLAVDEEVLMLNKDCPLSIVNIFSEDSQYPGR